LGKVEKRDFISNCYFNLIRMKIRKARLDDLKRIDEIYTGGSIDEGKLQFPSVTINEMIKNLKKFKKNRINGWKKELKSKNNYWIVLEDNKFILGFGNAEIKKNYGHNEGMCTMTYIDRRFRRKGFGFRITKELVSWLKKQKVKHIEAGFYYNNLPSIEMCRKLGFKPISLKMRLY